MKILWEPFEGAQGERSSPNFATDDAVRGEFRRIMNGGFTQSLTPSDAPLSSVSYPSDL